MKVYRAVAAFVWNEDCGQDLAEYCLMTALIALIGLGIFWHVSGGLQGMWNSINASLAACNNSAGPSAGSGINGN